MLYKFDFSIDYSTELMFNATGGKRKSIQDEGKKIKQFNIGLCVGLESSDF